MSYNLIIADDKDIIRDGLSRLVDWRGLGFKVRSTFSDGKEVIEYLKEYHVDAVLTDIRMQFYTGIDIARYVFENNLPTKVVLISAYRDFELAREAMQYEVKWYILKPTKLPEIKNVFLEVKDQLDSEKNDINSELKIVGDDRITDIIQRQFFIDLFWRALSESYEIEERIKDISFEFNIYKSLYCVFSIQVQVENDGESIHEESIKNCFRDFVQPIYLNDILKAKIFYVYWGNMQMNYMAVFNESISQNDIESILERHFSKYFNEIRDLFGYDTKICVKNKYKNLQEYTDRSKEENTLNIFSKTEMNSKMELQTDPAAMEEYLKQLVQCIRENKKEIAINLLNNIMDVFLQYAPGFFKVFITGLFTIIIKKIDITNEDFSTSNSIDLIEVFAEFETPLSLQKKAIEVMNDLIKNSEDKMRQSHYKVIEKAKAYILEHYYEDIHLEDVSEQVYLSPVYFSKMFKIETGINFSEFLTRCRIQKAIELMGELQYKVYEIAEKVGYRNTRYFYKIFKQYTGYTPTEYRNKN